MKKTVRDKAGSNINSSSNARNPSSSTSHRHDVGTGILLTLSGAIALGGLFSLSYYVKLDNLLLVSQAIYNVISGMNGIGLGICRLLLGMAQMVGISTLAVIAVASILAVSSGLIRLCLKLLPQLSSNWNFLARVLNKFVGLLTLPQPHLRRRNSVNNNSKPNSALNGSELNYISVNRAA